MKTKIVYIAFIAALISIPSLAQKTVKTDIKVFGNCGMCRMRIQTALDVPGVKFAEWNTETKNLHIVYNSSKISESEIHDLIASVGHDTDKVKAKDEVYGKLPFCCLYRDHDHSGMKDEEPHHQH